jgi:hypothetical protein
LMFQVATVSVVMGQSGRRSAGERKERSGT